MKDRVGAEFPILADPGAQVAKAYGVFDVLRDGLAAPSAFIIDEDRNILWSFVGSRVNDRARPPALLTALGELEGL